MNKIRVLQLGEKNWNNEYQIPQLLSIEYAERFLQPSDKLFDLVFWDRTPMDEELEPLFESIKAYTLFVTSDIELSEKAKTLYDMKKGQKIEKNDISNFLNEEAKFFFAKPYGEKYQMENIGISRNFEGNVEWKGQYELALQGNFGPKLEQIIYWKNNIPVFANQSIDLWLEYKKTPGVKISLVVTRILAYSLSEIIEREEFTEEELENVVQITAGVKDERIFMSINACGSGSLSIIALHDRYSRGRHGYFLPGGERYVTSDREEVFCYFDPMDRKPPLNIYFSGYKTVEGFEGYNLMRKMGAPYLLISESRLEGGSFYMGSEEYEKLISDVIRKYMKELNFTSEDVIISGLSMGTFGALYYGCDIKPYALLLGKPLVSIGDVAANEKTLRPGGFPTSIDVLRYITGGTDKESVNLLNDKFWNRFDSVEWDETKYIISYMIEDDYDSTAYQKLIEHIQSAGVQLFGKGMHGRHNDNTGGIVSWFSSQFKNLLREDFERTI